MDLFKAVLMGVVQGVTEFLPISSSGHLALFKHILHMDDISDTFDVILHIGTLIAVFAIYRKDILRLFVNGIALCADFCMNVKMFVYDRTIMKKEVKYIRVINTAYRKFALLVIVSTIPTGLMGYFGQNVVEQAGRTLVVPGICLLITGVILLISDNVEGGVKTPKRTTYTDAVIMGIVQGFATLPGISRSGSTITAGVALGLRRDFAVKYSFIMSIPAILGAAVLKVGNMIDEPVESSQLTSYLIGMLVSAVVGYICIKTLLVLLKGRRFKYFAYYCFAVGGISIVWYIGSILLQKF
ncbi:MAG: undecaprenyl-diphosphate phosphatase [Lachnospiraceae bacterium]|nr:undecaprenyl-diphosphate phosphatase [Lachnospiraceae bacterium]